MGVNVYLYDVARVDYPPSTVFLRDPNAVPTDKRAALTGVSATGSVGTLTPSSTVPITGSASTGSLGTLAPSTTVPISGLSGTGAVGTLAPSTTIAITGNSNTGSVGTLTPSTTVALTGSAATGAVGTLDVASSVAITGNAATGNVGSVAVELSILLSGIEATSGVGSVFIFPIQYLGLKAYFRGAVNDLCLVSETDAPTGMGGVLKINKNVSTDYAIYLVETNDPYASPIRIKTSVGTKAIRLKT